MEPFHNQILPVGWLIANASVHKVRLLVAAIAKPRKAVVQFALGRLRDDLRDSTACLARVPLFFRKTPVEVPADAHAAFQIDVTVANPITESDWLKCRVRPFVERDVLTPRFRRGWNGEPALFPRNWEIGGEAFQEKLGRKKSSVSQTDYMYGLIEGNHFFANHKVKASRQKTACQFTMSSIRCDKSRASQD